MTRPEKPTPTFPLSPNLNGQWWKKISGKAYYFGSWKDDPKGERAIQEYAQRQAGILAGTDHLRMLAAGQGQLSVGDLLREYLAQRKVDNANGSLSDSMYGGYLQELTWFAEWAKPTTAVAALKPEHFTAYASHLITVRKLKAHARKRVQASVKSMFRWGPSKGFVVPDFGIGFKSPSTTKEAIRKEKARAGIKDHSERILTGGEVDRLIADSQPNMRAMILLAVNCGLGPADIGRLQWYRIDMKRGMLNYPRPKTGNLRMGYLWKRTREALHVLLHPKSGHPLKRTKLAYDKDGENALVFITRKGEPYWRTTEDIKDGKTVGVSVHNAISITFGRLAKAMEMDGVSFYRLRHTFNTLAKKAKDQDALNLAMGHVNGATGETYNHEDISFKRIRRVALTVKKRLWPKPKQKVDTSEPTKLRIVGDGDQQAAA